MSKLRALGVAFAAASSPLPLFAQTTLRVVKHSDLKIVDPIWTTAYITRDHGYMIYDTLFATDASGQIKPQMIDKYDAVGRQAHVDDDAARRPAVARRHAGDRGGLRRVDPPLGRQGRDGPEDDVVREGHARRRCEDVPHRAERADGPRADRARQAVVERAVHDAEARRGDRSQHADLRLHGLRAVRVPQGRVEAGRQVRVREVGQVQAAQRAAVGARRRQGREGRSRRVAVSSPISRRPSTR